MQYKPYGKTGFMASILGFGAMRLPGTDGQIDPELSLPILRRGLDLGINYIDSAHVYGKGFSEVAVGKAIEGYDRSKLFLVTKVPAGSEEDAQADVWRKKLDLSLERLGTHIDLILFHGLRWNVFESLFARDDMALAAARKAQAEGLVKHIGFSSHDTEDNIIKLIDTGEFAGVLMQYNYLDRHNEPAINRAAEKGVGVTIMGPVAGGRLALPAGVLVDSEGMLEMKTPEVALRFVWSNPGVNIALSGMNTIEMVEENVASANRLGGMDDQENAAVMALMERNQKLADLYCTGCEYCMPCPNEVNIAENFRYMNWYKVWGMEQQAREAYARLSSEGTWGPWYPGGRIVGLKADACTECGECLSKCPQNIPIPDQLREVVDTLGTPPVTAAG
jgi:predicted aldo/keto reductase-like oxidoreductase